MIHVRPGDDWKGWRTAARRLLAAGVPPDEVLWRGSDDPQELFDPEAAPPPDPPAGAAAHRVSGSFLRAAEAAACHRDPGRWDLLYRLLWRIANGEPRLMEVAVDPQVHRLLRMEKAVRRATHKMHAFVRFRAVERDGRVHYIAWFEPEHRVVARAAPFFAERFASMLWSILTPDGCAHWDGDRLSLTPGVDRGSAAGPDALESLWRAYYASTFNPARVRVSAMRGEMPGVYWKNLPEADLIHSLVRDAPRRVRKMIERNRKTDG